ncbi:Tyrosine recombinase XerC protein [Marine Group I thaumarchaeote SCGC AAA799-E16]|uniref:Site-specific recombinase XerC protein n=2 Tax=Marine Group I TaxID=905826 RepID=A0A087S179_9ARCH|nr:Tyrosine recombinase XerC protein [Marine Group I thaumarchaeote SCGC AAA799-E16]KFM19483.1 site-specific recombinase XerC protein [Marine Group I thaumarchaeote SCGC RSA3]
MQKTTTNNSESFLDSLFVISQSTNTQKTYKVVIRRFQRFLHEKHGIDEFQMASKIKNDELDIFQLLQNYVVYQNKTGLSGKTIRVHFSVIRGYLRHIGIRIDRDDLKEFVKVPKQTKLREMPITREILVRVLHNANPKLQTAILVATSTGLRIGELAQLKISDIDFATVPTTIYVRGETTKTKTSRETFLTSEATNTLKDFLKRFHNWSENTKDRLILDSYIFGSVIKPKNNGKFSLDSAIFTLSESLRNILKSNKDLEIRNENGRMAIHFHAFRKFFRTTLGNVAGRDYAEALMGHSFYMDTYYQLPEDKKKQMFLDAEPHLTLSDFETVEKNIKKISEKNSQLEEKFNDLLDYLRTNKIEVPNF